MGGHPRNAFVREHLVTALVDGWLAKTLAPHRIKQTIAGLHEAQEQPIAADTTRARAKIAACEAKLSRHRAEATIEAMAEQISGTENSAAVQLRKQLSTCDQRLNQYRAALNAGADAVQVARWINDTEQERARLEGELRAIPADQAVSSDGLAELLHQTGELAHAVVNAHPDDKADLYAKLGLKMMYYPQKKLVEARVVPTSTCANGLCPRSE